MKKVLGILLTGVMLVVAVSESSWSAMQIRKRPGEEPPAEGAAAAPAKPAPAEPGATSPPPPPAPAPSGTAVKEAPKKAPPAPSKPAASIRESFSGTVSFVSGKKVLVELDEAAKPQQRYSVYDIRLRRRGSIVVVRAMDKEVHLCTVVSGSVSEGDRLARETEQEAYARVRRAKSVAALKQFLEVFPDSSYRPKVAMEIFRQTLRASYQTFPGSTVTGKLALAEKPGQEIMLGRALVKIDRFVVGMTDDNGRFRIDGIPPLDEPVTVTLSVRDEKFQSAGDVQIELPAGKTAELEKDIPVKLTPTYLAGRVVDENGNPVKGAQVWTSPYTMEKLTDENGEYKIWRRKKLDTSGAPVEGDEPLMGRDYEVYAYRQGFGAERVEIAAQSYVQNDAPPLHLQRQDPLEEGIPGLDVSLRDNIDLMQYVLSAGAGPKINQ